MKDKLEMLVRKVVMDYLNKEKTSQTNKHILVILDDLPGVQTNEVWEQIKLLASNYNTTILYSSKWTNIPENIKCVKCVPLHEEYLNEIRDEMKKADVLFYATSSYSTLAKLSLTMDDDLSMWITIQMQMNGKQILLANDHYTQKGTQRITTPFTVSKRIRSYFRQLREDKVQFVSLSQTCKWLDSYFDNFTESRHIVLAKHIEEAAKLGESQLIVPKNSLITPMCKDYARELGVLIKQKG
ncbi:MAG TPA: hypothetical protein VK190_04125 [Pseudoneobacillus sp.]|nr:hypothetical protein [Pseudoneobacillus sp.]